MLLANRGFLAQLFCPGFDTATEMGARLHHHRHRHLRAERDCLCRDLPGWRVSTKPAFRLNPDWI